jgi:tetratricopeptide (TPR) repeat protein
MQKPNKTKILGRLGFILILFISLSCHHKEQKQNPLTQQKIDSLLNDAEDSIPDNITYANSQIDQAFKLAQDSVQYYTVLDRKSLTYLMTDKFDSAYRTTKQTIKFCNKPKPSAAIVKLISSAYNSMGIYYSRIGDNDSARNYFNEGYKNGLLIPKTSSLVDIIINLADSYFKLSDYPNATFYYRKALFLSDSLQVTGKFGFPIYFGLGQVYLNLRDFALSDYYFKQAEKTLNERTLNEKFIFCNNRGNYYYYNENYPQALFWFKKAWNLVVPANFQFAINLCELNMSDVFLHLNQLDSATYYSDRSFNYFLNINHKTALYYLSTIKAGIALKQKNTGQAYAYLKNYSDNADIETDMIIIRNKFLQDYYNQVGDYQKAYQYLQRNTDINKSIQSERVKGRVAELDMRYKQDTMLLKRNLLIQTQQNKLQDLRFSRYLLVIISLFVLMAAIFIYFYMRKQHDMLQIKHFDQIAKLRMQNIRNRISPHFIFNILNQEIDYNTDIKNKTELPGLVKILRRSLEISGQLSVTLAQELEFVKTYITLEQKSLGAHFNLLLDIDDTIDTEKYNIPAMIVQIPIENAIKHAFRGNDNEKILHISVTNMEKGIQIQITDNGPGYQPTNIHKNSTGTGLKVIYQTIDLLNAKNKEHIQFSIYDLSKQGKRGTGVEIYVPTNYAFAV